MPSLSLFIPAYNAEKHLASVIKRIPSNTWKDIRSCIIVNDGSTDKTNEIIHRLEQENPKIKGAGFARNQGYGKAVKYALALLQKREQEYAICLHADGQYAPECIPAFLCRAKENHYDILQGSRMAGKMALKGGMPLYKYVAGRLLTFLENRTFRLSMTDYHSGYLCYSQRAIQTLPFERFSNSFDFDLEVIACARKMRLNIGEIPIPTRYADEKSHLNPVTYGLRVLRIIMKYVGGSYAYP